MNLVKPERILIEENREDDKYRYARFVIQPLERGYGLTIGNALRRVLLSSIFAPAVTKIRVRDEYHEFTSLKGVKEDLTEIVLNIKQLQIGVDDPEDLPQTLIIEKKGSGEIKGEDIRCPAGVRITNPSLHIATLNDDADVYMELYAEYGKGYWPTMEREIEDDIQMIPIDAVFTPVVRVNFNVGNTRVGKKTNYDKLTLEIWTKKNADPLSALKESAKILEDYISLFSSDTYEGEIMGVEIQPEAEKEVIEVIEEETPIEKLHLNSRSVNALKRSNIFTVEALCKLTPKEILNLKNLGKKSLEEIKETLKNIDLKLADESREGSD